jgi:tRNA dimethylallyltransferase
MSAALSAAPEPLPFRLLALSLEPSDRGVLHARIAARFDAMLKAGLTGELAALRKQYQLTPALPSMRCVGYRQAWEFLDGRIDLAQLREQGIIATRQLAKRQLTWLRSMDGLTGIDCLRTDLGAAARAEVKNFLPEIT